jgi:hypothetical protein
MIERLVSTPSDLARAHLPTTNAHLLFVVLPTYTVLF